MKISRVAILLLLVAAVAAAADVARPAVGAEARDLELLDLEGEHRSLAAGLQDGPMVVVFFRGAW